ncbi:MAG TPA: class I SAM-dependent methyltransferase, partial [Thermoanaerobaculia bacterium]
EFRLDVPESARRLEVDAVWEDGDVEPLFEYDLADVRARSAELDRKRRSLASIPMPSGEIVALTQGHRDVEGYRNSIIPGVGNMRRYLTAAGIDADAIRSVLDFGCGSGRLLTGWMLEESDRALAGCDPNAALAGWARENLPARVRIDHTSLLPPLPYRDAEFDLAFAISVFTHLKFATQRVWARELARVVAPGGALLVTLHGPFYAGLFAPERATELEREGHFELEGAADGSNEFASFHLPQAVEALFDEFEAVAYFPEGRIRDKRVLFPLAGLQDVHVLRRRSTTP